MNSHNRVISLRRLDVCDMLLAITSVRCSMMSEINDPQTTETRREIVRSSLRKWDRLHDEIERQLDIQDALEHAAD